MEDCLAGDPEKVETQSVFSWICMLDIDGTVELSKEFHGPVRFSRKFGWSVGKRKSALISSGGGCFKTCRLRHSAWPGFAQTEVVCLQ